jgi:hypothetical protein
MHLLLSAAHETYSCIQHNDNRMRNSEKIQSSITVCTTEKNKWEELKVQFDEIESVASK